VLLQEGLHGGAEYLLDVPASLLGDGVDVGGDADTGDAGIGVVLAA
jgi:hypothetical protein